MPCNVEFLISQLINGHRHCSVHVKRLSSSACRDARPGLITRAVTKHPIPCMLVVLALCACASILPFLEPPSINASFETLTVQDQPVNDALSSSNYLLSGSDSFWSSPSSDTDLATNGTSGTVTSVNARRLQLLATTFPLDPLDAHSTPLTMPDLLHPIPAHLAVPSRRLSDAATVATDIPFRNNIDFALHVVFFKDDGSTMLTRETLANIKRIEDDIFALPAYTRLCLHMSPSETGEARRCRRPVSVTNFAYGRFAEDGAFMADGSNDEAQDPVKAAQVPAPLPEASTAKHHSHCHRVPPCLLQLGSMSVQLWRMWCTRAGGFWHHERLRVSRGRNVWLPVVSIGSGSRHHKARTHGLERQRQR